MTTTISTIAFAVRTASALSANPIKLSHAQQLVAAALGYKSLAAYQASEELLTTFDGASHYVLDWHQLAERAKELNLPQQSQELETLLEGAFKDCLPDAHIHASEGAVDDYFRHLVEQVVMNDADVTSAMAMANHDGVREIYLPLDDFQLSALPTPGESLDLSFEGHVSMEVDTERPYSGHHIDVEVAFTVEAKGKVCFAEPQCEVLQAKLDFGWGDDEEEAPRISLTEAIAQELGLETEEAEQLVDAEPIENASDDGLIYSYIFDFSETASPSIAQKIMAKYGQMQVEVSPWFFDRIRHVDY